MSTPQYRARLQALANFLVSTMPEDWAEAVLQADFPSRTRTDLAVRYIPTGGSEEFGVAFDGEITYDFAQAAKAVQAELVNAGNPKCRGFLFRLTKDGRSSLDVDY